MSNHSEQHDDEVIIVPGGGKIHPAHLTDPIVAEAARVRAQHDQALRKVSDAFPEEKAPLGTSRVVEDAEDANGGVSEDAGVAGVVAIGEEVGAEVEITPEEELDGIDPSDEDEDEAEKAPTPDEVRAQSITQKIEEMTNGQIEVLLAQSGVTHKKRAKREVLIGLAIKALTPETPADTGELDGE